MASGDDAATTRTEFAIRYFPHPDEDAFESFAPIEQATRGSTLFDATGTPTVEEFDTIEPSLFHVATLALSPSRALLNIDFAAQDCWLETDTADEAVAVRRAVRWREKTSASRVLAALASPPATKALDPDPFPRHSLRHAVYAALLHFGLETAASQPRSTPNQA